GLGQQYLSMADARNPAAPIADPQALIQQLQQQQFAGAQTRSAQEFEAQQTALNRAMQTYLGQLNAAGRYGASAGYGPRLPTDYGTPGAARPAPIHPNIPPDATPEPDDTGAGGFPNLFGVDNWSDLTPAQQREYLIGAAQNPYLGAPDYTNPYSGDEPPPEPAPNLTGYNDFSGYYA